MRNFKIILSIAIILTMSMYSCKKSRISEPQNQSDKISYSKQIIQRINDFQRQLSSELKSGTSISLDSAIWSMEASLNYNYAHPDSASANLVILKSYYNINIDATNKVLLSDVQAIYNLIEDTLLYQYSLFPSINKHVVFSDAKTDSIVSSTAFISVANGFGINPAILYDPFDEDDDWIWGTLDQDPPFNTPPTGKCDGTMVGISDGGDELERRLNNPHFALPPASGYTDIEVEEVTWNNCYYLEPWNNKRVFWDLDYNHCMQNGELINYLNEYDYIIYTFNDPSNDNGSLLIEDGEGARPNGKDFMRIHIVDDFALFNSYWHHNLQIRYGIPYSHSGE